MDTKRAEEILLETKEIFDTCNIEFFLICGTCLGAVREKIIMTYDGDIDIGVKHEILIEKILILTKAFKDKGYSVEMRTCQYNYPRSFDPRKDGVHICIRNYDLSGDKRFNARIIAPDNNTPDGTCSVFDKKLFENLKKIKFLGTEFLVPNPPEEYLKQYYGDRWRIPFRYDHVCRADVANSFSKLTQGKK